MRSRTPKTNSAAVGAQLIMDEATLKAAFEHETYDGVGRKLLFSDVVRPQRKHGNDTSCPTDDGLNFDPTQPRRYLVIFVRHFLCGNCQEYLRRLASEPSLSPASLAQQNINVAIVGCGAPSLIQSYRVLAGLPKEWQLYTDPSLELYRLLGMQRSLSLGDRSPKYIQRSLTGNMVRSVVQGIMRIPSGDVLNAGGWDVQGGEYLFEARDNVTGSDPLETWRLTWSHQMLNSRDHTEIEELSRILGLATGNVEVAPNTLTRPQYHTRAKSTPMILEDDSIYNEKLEALKQVKRHSSIRRALSVRRDSWMNKSSKLNRSMSTRHTVSATAA